MSKHTPGPWYVITDKHGYTCISTPDDDHVVCFGHGYDEYGGFKAPWRDGYDAPGDNRHDDECKANARLIAAAPELLEASRFLIESVEASEDGMDRLLTAFDMARAAIAKATGEA